MDSRYGSVAIKFKPKSSDKAEAENEPHHLDLGST
jgi:hypothetical protein